MNYKVEIENDDFEIIFADNDADALSEAWQLEDEGHCIFNVFLIDEEYNEVRCIL